MPNTTIWPLEPHTAAKHQMLEQYLKGWFPIMAKYEPKVLYIDGFSGPGRYSGGEPGSPLIALDVLLNHPMLSRWDGTTFYFAFWDEDSRRSRNLKAELDRYFSARPKLENIVVVVEATTFSDAADDLYRSIGEGKRLIPTFAFVDPFGFKGVPMDLICRLLSFEKCELLINFMFESINRWVTADNEPEVHRRLVELFGTDRFQMAPAGGRNRQKFLVELYKEELRHRRFKFVRSMEMVSLERHRTVYHLVYGTQHPTGVKVMKRAMWKLDPELGRRFTPQADDVQALFASKPDYMLLREAIRQRFGGERATIAEVESFVNDRTDFMADSHLKKATLVPMEEDGLITSVQGRSRPRTFPPGSVIAFR